MAGFTGRPVSVPGVAADSPLDVDAADGEELGADGEELGADVRVAVPTLQPITVYAADRLITANRKIVLVT